MVVGDWRGQMWWGGQAPRRGQVEGLEPQRGAGAGVCRQALGGKAAGEASDGGSRQQGARCGKARGRVQTS